MNGHMKHEGPQRGLHRSVTSQVHSEDTADLPAVSGIYKEKRMMLLAKLSYLFKYLLSFKELYLYSNLKRIHLLISSQPIIFPPFLLKTVKYWQADQKKKN